MRQADQLLDDETLVELIYQGQGNRRALRRRRGCKQAPRSGSAAADAEVPPGTGALKPSKWEVWANLLCRELTRIGTVTVPGAKVVAKSAQVIGPQVIANPHRRVVVELSGEQACAEPESMGGHHRVVETNFRYLTDTTLRRVTDGVA